MIAIWMEIWKVKYFWLIYKSTLNSFVSTIFGSFPIVPILSSDIIRIPSKNSLKFSHDSNALATLISEVSPRTSLAIRVASPSLTDGLLLITVTLSALPKLIEWPIFPDEVQIPKALLRGLISKAILFLKFHYLNICRKVSFGYLSMQCPHHFQQWSLQNHFQLDNSVTIRKLHLQHRP